MLTNNMFISHSSGGWKFKSKAPVDSASGESPSPGSGWHLLTGSSHGRSGEGALWGLFYKGMNPIHDGSTLVT